MATGGPDTRDELLQLEIALARRDPSGIDGGLGSLIADDFIEFGASGRPWTATGIRELLAAEPPSAAVEILDFEVVALADGVVLVTYRIAGSQPSNRSSIWLRHDGRWVIRFHQGTPRDG